MTILLVVGIFVALIVVHELGHFLVAKLFGVRVDEFGLGYPPRAFTFGTWGGTEYTLNWIPFGGFVKLFGEEEERGLHGKGSFMDAPRTVQAMILVAGVGMNVLLAWGLFAWSFTLGIPQSVDAPLAGETAHLYITNVLAGSPASAAGIIAGDEIVLLSDTKNTSTALTPNAVQAFIRDRGGKPLNLTYVRADATSTVVVRPANAVVPQSEGRPALGVGLALVVVRMQTTPEAILSGARETWNVAGEVVAGLGQLITDSVTGKLNLQNVVGPVGIATFVGQAAHSGFGNLLRLVAFISMNLAVINLVPIPVLDGGRLLLLGIESLLRRPAPKVIVQFINTLGLALIIILMVAVTYHDIARLLA